MTSPDALHALMFSRYMAEYGASRSHLAEISVAFRNHTIQNPGAVMRKPIPAEDHAAARPIVTPLHLLDYCLVNDGGVALIVSDATLEEQTAQIPVFVRGCAHASDFSHASFPSDDYWRAAIGRAGEACFREAGAGPTDMSGLAIYDNFTPSVLFALEGFGYCPPGTAWARIQDGRLRLGGRWPTNTSGGHLSDSYMQGWGVVAECVRQLRDDCGARQIPGVQAMQYICATNIAQSAILRSAP